MTSDLLLQSEWEKQSCVSFQAEPHYCYHELITVYKLVHIFPNYIVLIGNFDNYCSNFTVSDD